MFSNNTHKMRLHALSTLLVQDRSEVSKFTKKMSASSASRCEVGSPHIGRTSAPSAWGEDNELAMALPSPKLVETSSR